ncbi:family 43 glycoside hydrolase [Cryphonectria parasitica EP155]|uniref:Endo-1,5-alpha-L-arabinanase A n=1 Tax=Cryphonectria parasitica (strain ATCC 38755 / EP155) TaxID=660469 RepID=A0A9P4Y0M0_CRYP1|nr:family 43 glycoside hydrolase [Cryphonectria parasitica EP155]KAF3764200.1 family 43 glycoside hydrolase [Cryphonectria parasitica EP155]
MKGGAVTGIRDPSLIRRSSDGTYFLFGTMGNGTVHTAHSIHGPWTREAEGALDIAQTVVGPQVYEIDGTYYMYYSQHTGKPPDWYYTANIHVASSKTMEHGSWTLHGELDIPMNNERLANHKSTDGYNVLDASLLVADGAKDKYYLSFGSYYTGLYQTPLNSPINMNAKETAQEMTHLEYNSTGGHSTEGSFQFAWPTDGSAPTKYYLFFSSGQCCKFQTRGVPPPGDEYKIMVCRADHPAGPYLDQDGRNCLTQNGGTIVLGSHGSVYAPGGQGVMYSEELHCVVLYYHYTPANKGKPDLSVGDTGTYFGFNQLSFDKHGWEGWPVITLATGDVSTAPADSMSTHES